MKIFLPVFSLVLLGWFSAAAQVTVEVVLDQKQFLPRETLPLTVRITNRSGQPLHLGAKSNWLKFSVTTENNSVVSQIADVPVVGEFDLDSSETAIKHVDIAPYFNLAREGSYRVVAVVRINDWNDEIYSPPQSFDVIDGARLWSQSFGIPMSPDVTNRMPEVRKYTLEEANYLHSQLRMYVEVSDEAELHIYSVRAIGPMVSFSQPEARLDRVNRLHVLYQSGARVFTYSMIDTDGNIVRQENYDYLDSRPRLKLDDNGDIIVLGGVRRVKATDVPLVLPPAPVPTSAPAKP